MPSLLDCLRTSRRFMSADDVSQIEQSYNAGIAAGLSEDEAARVAIRDTTNDVLQMRAEIIQQVPALIDAAEERALAIDGVGELASALTGEQVDLGDAAQITADPAQTITNDVRERFDDVLRGKARRGDWAREVGVDEEALNTLIDEAVTDGRLQMVDGVPRRARQTSARARAVAPTRDLAQQPTQAEPVELIPDTAAGVRIARLKTSIQRNYVRALYEAALDSNAFNATASYIANDKNLTTAEVLDIVEAYTGKRPSALIKRRETAIKKMRATFDERVRDVEIAQMRGSDIELAPSNLLPRPDVRPQIERLIADVERARGMSPFEVHLVNFLRDSKTGVTMAGVWQNGILSLALDRPVDEVMRVMRHEMIHALRGVGVITEQHFKALVSVGKRRPSRKEALRIIDRMETDGGYGVIDENGRMDGSPQSLAPILADLRARAGKLTYRELYRVDEQYTAFIMAADPKASPEDLRDALDEEVVAHIAEDWADGRNFGTRVERALTALRDFLQTLATRFNAMGYTSANQLFDSIYSGQIARQAERARARRVVGRWGSREMMAARSRGTLSIPGLKSVVEKRLAEQEAAAPRRDPALSGIFRPDAPLEWAGLEDAEFFGNLAHIAEKRRTKEADLPQPETEEAVAEHIAHVLENGSMAFIYQPERGPESLNIIAPGARYDSIIALRLDQDRGRYHIRTAFNQRKDKTSRGLIMAVERGGLGDVWWKTDQDSQSEILKRIAQAPSDNRGPSRNVLKAAVLQSQARPAKMAMRVDREAGVELPDAFWAEMKQLDRAVEGELAQALEAWVGGPADTIERGLTDGLMMPERLEAMVAEGITDLTQPVRDLLARYAPDGLIKVYRGEREGGAQSEGRQNLLFSYSTDRRVAEAFAGTPGRIQPLYAEAQIAAAERQLAELGEVTVGRVTYRPNPEAPQYIDMFDRDDGFITDTESVRRDLENQNQYRQEWNERVTAAMQGVRELVLPVRDVVWATDRFNQREIIAIKPAKMAVRSGRGSAVDSGLLPNGDHVDRISTRWPALVSSTEDPVAERLVIDQDAMRATPDAYKFNAGVVRGYVNWPKANRDRNPDKVFDAFKEQIKGNLRWLYDQVPPEIRAQSKNWYDGARIITDQWSEDFNQPPRAIAGVLAALSPGKDWYANVSMGERLLDIWTERQDYKWDGRMTKTANRQTKQIDGSFKSLVDPEILKAIKGKTLAELVESDVKNAAARFIRIYDETYHDGMLRIVSADGRFIGDPQQKINWQSYALIQKAVNVLIDSSYENISAQMGEAHKIRNFYNNILAPNARFGDVTIDTHAIAAALLRPLAQKSTEVAHGLGTSPPKGIQNVKAAGLSGSKGLYGIYADAYREAAQELQVLPRELQSITWEAVRGLYPRAWKRDANVAMIDGIWRDYKDGTISLDEARARVLDAAGGIEAPSWYRPDGGGAVASSDTSYEGELSGDRVSRRRPERVQPAARPRGRGNATRRSSNLAKYAVRARPGPATPHGQMQFSFDQTPEERTAQAEADGFDTGRVLYFLPAETPEVQDQQGGAQGRGKIHLFGSMDQISRGALGDPSNAVAVWVRGKLMDAQEYRNAFKREAGIDLAETTDPDTVAYYTQRLNDRFMSTYTGIQEAWKDERTGRYLATQSVAMFDTSDIRTVEENRSPGYVGPMAAIRTYHGSGARFTQFDYAYMGTGEGAQAYAWGTYLADVPGTAKTYMPRQFDVESFALSRYNRAMRVDDYATAEAWERAMMHETPDEIRAYAAEYIDDPNYIDAFEAVADALEAKIETSETVASLYEVDFNVETDELLDWDLPIAQQPARVLKALEPLISMPRDRRDELVDMVTEDFENNGPLGYSPDRFRRVVDEAIKSGGYGPEFGFDVWDEIREAAPNKANAFIRAVSEAGVGLDWEQDTGATAYSVVASSKTGPEIAEAFRAAGIPGLRFLDQLSRDGDGATYNYVVFDLDRVEITKRNGKPISKGERGFAMAAMRANEPEMAEAEIDDLRFYSGLQVAALGLKQQKGTPEQMLAQLKKAGGVREAEIAAVGLDKMLEGRDSVTKDEILEIIELGRVRLLEAVYEHAGKRWSNIIIDDEELTVTQALRQLSPETQPGLRAQWLDAERRNNQYARDSVLDDMVQTLRIERLNGLDDWSRIVRATARIRRPRWSGYSIDPDNKTYKEHTLYVPPPRLVAEVGEFKPMNEGTEYEGVARWPSSGVDISGVTAAEVVIGDNIADITHYPQAPDWPGGVYIVWSNQIQNAQFSTLEAAVAEIEKRHNESASFNNRDDVFTQMHFSEDPNVVVHTRTTIQADLNGKLNYTLNELQSDWGQAYTKWERTRPQQSASNSVQRRLGAIKAQLEIYDNATRVWWSLQKGKADPYEQVPIGFVAPLNSDAATIARSELAEVHQTTFDDVRDVMAYEEESEYIDYWVRERERTYAEMDNALRTQPFHQEILDVLETREAQAEAAVRFTATKYAEANNLELPDAVLDSKAWYEFISDVERRESMTHPLARAWNTWIVNQQLTDLYRDRAGLAEPEGFSPSHPLIENTDTWVNLGLRRLLVRAVEAGADYVAIASGETVDSLNMGTPITGALYAYNVMYPKKMRDILKKIDKEAAQPEKVKDLVSSVVDVEKERAAAEEMARAEGADDADSILRVLTINNRVGRSKQYRVFKSQGAKDDDGNWLYDVFIEGKSITENPVTEEAADKLVEQWKGNLSGGYGFVRFRITPKVRDAVLKNGMPMMAARSREPRGPSLLDRIMGREPKPRQLNQIISDLKRTLGIETSQRMYRLDVKIGDRTLRLRPPKGQKQQYVRESGSAGVRQTRDIKAIARVGGFALESMIGQPLADIQNQHVDELVPDGMTTPPGGRELSEAFTRWFERYVTDREGARLMAPSFFEAFEDVLDAEVPAVLQDLSAVVGAYQEYLEQATPDQVAADLVSVYSKNDWKTIDGEGRNIAETTNGRMATAYTAVIDDMHPIKMLVRRLLAAADAAGIKDEQGRPISLKVAENAYKLARMFRGAHATGYTYITKGIPYYRGDAVMFPGLQKALDTLFGGEQYTEQEYKTFGNYFVHRRAVEEYKALAQKQQRLAGLDRSITQATGALSQLRQRTRENTSRLEARRNRLNQLNGALRTREMDLRGAIKADQTAQDRLGDLGQELSNALRQIEGYEEQRAEINRRVEEIDGAIPPDLMNALRTMAEGPGAMRQTRDQLLRRQRLMNRDAQRVRLMRERLQGDVDSLSTDVALLRAEVAQLEQRVKAQTARIDGGRDALELLRKERDRVRKIGASRPPTLEPMSFHLDQIAKIEADPRYKNIREAAKIAYDYNFGLLTLKYQAGLIPQEQYEYLARRRDWYVPFMRDMSDVPGGSIFQASGSSRAWSPFKKFDGSDRAIINPLEMMSAEAYRTAQHIAMNDMVNALAGLAERVGEGAGAIAQVLERRTDGPEAFDAVVDYAIQFGIDPADAQMMAQSLEVDWTNDALEAIWTPSSKGPQVPPTLPLWRNGRRTFVAVLDQEFGQDAVNAMKGMGKEQINMLVDTFLGTPARVLQIGVTTHPTFMPRNLIRDIFDAWIKIGALPIITQVEGAYHMWTDSEFYRQYMAAGGIVGGRNVAALSQREQQLRAMDIDPNAPKTSAIAMGAIAGGIVGTIAAGPMGGLIGAALSGYGARTGQLLKTVEAVETMTRVGTAAEAYRQAKAHATKGRYGSYAKAYREAYTNAPEISEQEAVMEAAYVARDIFDWNRRGSQTLWILRTITFLNAQIQGMDRAARGLAGSGDRGSAIARNSVRKHLQIVFKAENDVTLSADEQRDLQDAYKTFGRMMLYTLMLVGLYAVVMDDDDYEDVADRSRWTHSWLPDVFGVDIRIPKAFEWAIPANMIEIIYDAYTGRDPRWSERMVDSAYEVLAPPALPQAFALGMGYLTNKQFSTLTEEPRDIIPRWEKGLLDPELQYGTYTSMLARDLVSAMAAAGVPKSMQPSPYMIDFTLRTGGYWGRDIGRAYTFAREGVTDSVGMEMRVPDWPVIGGFTGNIARQSRSVDQFYKLLGRSGGEFTLAARSYADAIRNKGQPELADAALLRLPPDQRAYALLQFHGSPRQKDIHPLNRFDDLNRVIRSVGTDVVANQLVPGKRRGRNLSKLMDDVIELNPKTKTAIVDVLEKIRRAEAWNTMIGMNRPGWQGKKEVDVGAIMDTFREISPEAYAVFERRKRENKVLDWERVKDRWPSLQDQFLSRYGPVEE